MKGRSINQFAKPSQRSRHVVARMAILVLILLSMAPLNWLARPALAASVGTFSIDDVTVIEGDSGTVDAIFTVTLNRSASGTATVAYVAVNGSASVGGSSCPTIAGSTTDLLAASGSLTFDGETTTRNVIVKLCGDISRELDETFSLTLFAPVNANFASGGSNELGVGTIVNDDDNNAPVAVSQVRSNNTHKNTQEDTALTLTLVATDIDRDCPSFSILAGPQHGTLSGFGLQPCQLAGNTATGRLNVIYTPALNYFGLDSFTFKANDGAVDSNVAMVEINVISVNDPPVMLNDSYSVVENTTLTVPAPGVLANDSDPVEGNPLTAVLRIGSGPNNGTLTLNANGSFIYKPNTNFVGSDSFQYRASDGFSGSTFATVMIGVVAAQKAPIASNQSIATDEDTAAAITLTATDANGDLLTYTVETPAHGSLSGGPPNLIYTPDMNYNGQDSFTFKANDGVLDSNVATVTIAVGPVNDAPAALDDSYDTDEDSMLTIAAAGVLGNDIDVDDAALTAILVSGPSDGTLTLNYDGSFTYAPEADFHGSDSFSYQASDGSSVSNVATVTIAVSAANDAPVAGEQAVTTDAGTATAIVLTASDVDHDALNYSIVTGPAHGTLSGTAPDMIYTPNIGYGGADSFTFKADDGAAYSNVATVSITVNPPAILYSFSGFFQPVDNLPTLNSVSAGRAVPVKFSLGGYFGLNVFAAGYPASQQIRCDTAAPVDAVEETTTAGESSLSYDLASDRYIYVWKTEKTWAGTCRQLIVRFNDGSPDSIAYFKFVK